MVRPAVGFMFALLVCTVAIHRDVIFCAVWAGAFRWIRAGLARCWSTWPRPLLSETFPQNCGSVSWLRSLLEWCCSFPHGSGGHLCRYVQAQDHSCLAPAKQGSPLENAYCAGGAVMTSPILLSIERSDGCPFDASRPWTASTCYVERDGWRGGYRANGAARPPLLDLILRQDAAPSSGPRSCSRIPS